MHWWFRSPIVAHPCLPGSSYSPSLVSRYAPLTLSPGGAPKLLFFSSQATSIFDACVEERDALLAANKTTDLPVCDLQKELENVNTNRLPLVAPLLLFNVNCGHVYVLSGGVSRPVYYPELRYTSF